MTALEAFFPPAFLAAIGFPTLYLADWSSGWAGLALAFGLLVAGQVLVLGFERATRFADRTSRNQLPHHERRET